jgi:hypothetical protein
MPHASCSQLKEAREFELALTTPIVQLVAAADAAKQKAIKKLIDTLKETKDKCLG